MVARLGAALAGLWLSMAAGGAAAAEAHPGLAVYQATCAGCHDNPERTRSPAKSTLSAMSYQALDFVLTKGKMKVQGASLTDATRAQLIHYLTGKTTVTDDSWTQAMACPAARAKVDLSKPASVATFGFDAANTRTLTAKQAGLTKAGLARLSPAWAIAFPDVTMMRSQAVVVGDNLFLPVAEAGALYALDIADPAKPCLQWVYRTPGGAPLRTSAGFGRIADGRHVVAVSGQDSNVHLIDASTGEAIWTRNVGVYAFSLTTGTPRVLKDRIIVPVSQFEIMVGGDNSQTCCTNHGYLLSLDPKTGAQQWRYDTMEEAKPLRDRGDGKMLYGPSGAPIWNSPVVDEKRGLVYFGTGESNSPPAHRNTDALIAVRLADGKEAWSMQATARDIFNTACGPKPRPDQYNCVSDTVYRDVDFGASVVLGKLSSGKEVLFAGQKSGTVWALEPATGKVLWKRDIGFGGPMGGVHWGIAFSGDTVLAPISSLGRPGPGETLDPSLKVGLYALDASTGQFKWTYAVSPDCSAERKARVPRCDRQFGFSGAPTVIDGAVLQGSLDGRLFAIDVATGQELWRHDTARDWQALNGVPGKGGAIDGPSIIAANGMVFLNSGYGMFGQAPGNVFLAFKPATGAAMAAK